MQEICPVCGSKDIVLIDKAAGRYQCRSCDERFVFEKKEPQVVKEIVHQIVEKQIERVPTAAFSAKDVYNRNIESILEVTATFEDTDSCGTGFCISNRGYWITNAHVLIGIKNKKPVLCNEVYVCRSRSDRFTEAEIVYMEAGNDLALLHVSNEEHYCPVLFAKKDVEIGDKLFAIGNSQGDGLNLLDGIVGDVNRKFKTTPAFLFNALVTHGCSGGPVFNDKGEVCGITVGGATDAPGMNFAIPISSLREFLERAEREKQITIY